MLSDIEIAQKAEMKPITEIGESIGLFVSMDGVTGFAWFSLSSIVGTAR